MRPSSLRKFGNPTVWTGGALASLAPIPAFADICAQMRPGWDGTPVSAVQEALFLGGTVPALALILGSALVIRFRSQWGGLITIVLWTVLITYIIRSDPDGIDALARQEGCVGSPALFIAAVVAICVAIVLTTLPRPKRPDQ